MDVTTIVVTGAGGGGAHNLVGSIRERSRYRIVGTDVDRYRAARAPVDRAYVVPPADAPDYLDALNRIVMRENVALIIPTNDAEVEVLSACRADIRCRLFFPAHETVMRCLDKWQFHRFASETGIPVARTMRVRTLADVAPAFETLGPMPLWCRLVKGAGSKAATIVKDPEQARWWIRYWNEMRNVAISDFMISEFLPGRDFACQSTWKDGRLVIMKAAERLSYIEASARPSNMSSSPQLARTVAEPAVFDTSIEVVHKLDGARAAGNYCIDLKETARGEVCVTEVNIGRFFMINNLFNRSGRHSMADVYLALALDRPVDVPETFDHADRYLVRSLDTLPSVLSEAEIDARVHRLD
jgi:carbamoyl-phosphate synthase large subunit